MLRPGGDTRSIPTYRFPGPPQRTSASVFSPSATWVTRMYPIGADSSSAWKYYRKPWMTCPPKLTQWKKKKPVLTHSGYDTVCFRMSMLSGVCWTNCTCFSCNRKLFGFMWPHSWTRCASTHVIANWTSKNARKKIILGGEIVSRSQNVRGRMFEK